MSQQTSLAELRGPKTDPTVRAGFDTVGGFELIQRTAKLFASSNIVPTRFQGNLPNCVIAVDMALRMGANPLMVAQNLYVVHGTPGWSAKFLIATFNKSGKFSALRYRFQGKAGQDDWGCRAVATELSTSEVLEGPLITIGLAKKEGWYSKKDSRGNETSKWQSMPEQMLRYRAAAWFINVYSPEIAMGLRTAEEVQDTFDLERMEDGSYTVSMDDIAQAAPAAEPGPAETVNPETGEVTQAEPEAAPEPAKPAAKPVARPAPQAAPKPAPAERPKPAAEPKAAPASPGTFRCPNGTDKAPVWVTESDCGRCNERQGCPQWGDGEEVF